MDDTTLCSTILVGIQTAKAMVRDIFNLLRLQTRLSLEVESQIQDEQCNFRAGIVDQLNTLAGYLMLHGSLPNQSTHVLCGLGQGARPCTLGDLVEGARGVWGIRHPSKGSSNPLRPVSV